MRIATSREVARELPRGKPLAYQKRRRRRSQAFTTIMAPSPARPRLSPAIQRDSLSSRQCWLAHLSPRGVDLGVCVGSRDEIFEYTLNLD